jgi:hypothetical protein
MRTILLPSLAALLRHGQYRETLVNGVPTGWAWLSYLEGLAFFGIQGTAGGLAFYWAWRKLRAGN